MLLSLIIDGNVNTYSAFAKVGNGIDKHISFHTSSQRLAAAIAAAPQADKDKLLEELKDLIPTFIDIDELPDQKEQDNKPVIPDELVEEALRIKTEMNATGYRVKKALLDLINKIENLAEI